nr:putative ribonuclease H-like domain-containing protein [Tanacetum cinerariifolium]
MIFVHKRGSKESLAMLGLLSRMVWLKGEIVNKTYNKTPYELFNGKTHAIGFLKPSGCHVMILNTLDNLEPKKISDALQDPSWVEAMQEEILQFKIQKVWSLVDCLKRVRPIETKWVLKNKKDERGIVIRNKARLPHGFQDPEYPARV